MSDANACAKGPVSQSSSPLVLWLTMSRHLAIIRVAAVTVVKVEAVKEPVPSTQHSLHREPQHKWGVGKKIWTAGPFYIHLHRTYKQKSTLSSVVVK